MARNRFLTRIGPLGGLLLTLLMVVTPAVSAMSAAQQQLFTEGIGFYDINPAEVCGGSATTLTGSDNEEKIWNYFQAQGLSAAQIAGIMGNIQQESGFDPDAIQNGGDSQTPTGEGWGLIQWTPPSKALTDQSVSGVSGPIGSLQTQLDIVWQILNNHPVVTQPFDLTYYKTLNDPSAAATYFLQKIEGGTDPGGIREKYATEIMQKYQTATGSGATQTSSGGCSSTGSPDCQTVQGDAKILCAAEKYQGIYYEYGGGHQGYAAFKADCPDPSNPPDNQPTGGPANGDKSGNPSPCGLDCSGLVSVAVDDAFGTSLMQSTTAEAADSADWQHISLSQVQPGDLIQPDPGHVEIVDHVAGNTVYTFGSHYTGVTIGPTTMPVTGANVYLHYIGSGSQ